MSYLRPTSKWSRNLQLGLVVFQLTVGLLVVRVGAFPYAACVLVPFHAAMAAYAQRSIRREHRRTEGDRADQGASTDAAGGTVNVTISGDASRALEALRAASGARTGVDKSLPVRDSDEPIAAWKRAAIVLKHGRVMFDGISSVGGVYNCDDVARCHATTYSRYGGYPGPTDHANGPRLDCTCGFYAMADGHKPTEGIVLEVELYGDVIVCEFGYRAERQRVLSVTVPSVCSSALCDTRATLFTFIDGNGCGLCDEHAALAEHSPLLTPAPLSAVANALGTEVRWTA